jgi:hypothetical protein
MFPALFCVPNDHTSVAVFRARRVRDRAFEVAPYKIFHGSNGAAIPEESYAMDGRFGGHPSHISNPPVVLVAGDDVVFEGQWVHSGTTVFSMYCGSAIPMLSFQGHIPDDYSATGYRESDIVWADRFTYDHEHFLPVIEGVRRNVRVWANRWNPMSWLRPEDDEIDGSGSARGGSPVARAVAAQQQPSSPPSLPKHVADLLIRDAEARGSICPITMDPIKVATAVSTPCGHVFAANALNIWRSTHSTCPECRASL